ncbi:MAG: hypothetical protein ACI8PT_000754 [Gammaproteobacteria bacterium]|jgi:hypothetical protein
MLEKCGAQVGAKNPKGASSHSGFLDCQPLGGDMQHGVAVAGPILVG